MEPYIAFLFDTISGALLLAAAIGHKLWQHAVATEASHERAWNIADSAMKRADLATHRANQPHAAVCPECGKGVLTACAVPFIANGSQN